MIYTTGTIAGNGSTITGTGTNFTAAGSLIRVGCSLIAFTTPVQVLQITAITSGNALSVTPAVSPAIAAGTKYAILLSDSLSVDGLAQDIAETFGMYQKYMSGFADVMNGTGDVTIMINGAQVTVPGQKSLAKKGENSDITSLSGLTTPLSMKQGGVGASDPAGARAKLELGDVATRNINKLLVSDSSPSVPVMLQTNSDFRNIVSYDALSEYPLGLSAGLATGKQLPGSGVAESGFVGLINVRTWGNNSAGQCSFQIAVNDNVAGFRRTYQANGTWFYSNFLSWYHSGNTTRASDGTLKAASPVVKIFANGNAETNEESEGVTVTRQAPGVYLVEG
ncbi:hypothetical protein EDF88_4200, partial [Buttiauxella sp. BIGb0552]|uniref:phage tail fiber protein n=1 Tax=Buttiauxella sp. BIGb0552 TaxID=2485120 RepID=UPI0010DFE16A